MTTNGGDIIADILKNHQIPFIFTLCGGHISPILIGAKKKNIRVIDVRHEVNTVFAADAFARLTGIPGVAVVTAGPGVTNTITALKNAQMAQSPVILLGGAAATVIKGKGSLQDIDQISLLRSIVKQAVTINQNCDIVPVMEHAFQVAQSGTPGPVFVECPIDLLYDEDRVRKWYGRKSGKGEDNSIKSRLFQFYMDRHVNRMFECNFDEMTPEAQAVTTPTASEDQIKKAAGTVAEAKKPVMIIGSQAMLQPEKIKSLQKAVEILNMPVFLTGMARGLMGKDHPLQKRHTRSKALKSADMVLLAGMPCDFRLGYGKSIAGDAQLVSVNRSAADLKLNRKPDAGIQADPLDVLVALADRLKNRGLDFGAWDTRLEENDQARETQIKAQSKIKGDYINPLHFLMQMDRILKDNSILVADGGDFVGTASYILRPRGPLSWLDPGVFGTLGVGAGFAMGAKLSRPSAEVWLIYGDGASGYSLQEMDTFVRHGIPVIAVIGNDASWAQIARDQVEIMGDDIATNLARTDYHEVAKGYGAQGFVIKKTEDIADTLQQARAAAQSGKPVVVNVWIDKSDFRKGSLSM